MRFVLIAALAAAGLAAFLLAPVGFDAGARLARKTALRARIRGIRKRLRSQDDAELRVMSVLVFIAGLLPLKPGQERLSSDMRALVEKAGLADAYAESELAAFVRWLPPIAGAVGGALLAPAGLLPLAAGVAGGFALGRWYPRRILTGRAQRRGRECLRDLPMMLDMLAMGMRAGLSFDAAFEIYTDRVDGVLASECRLALSSWKSGVVLRDEALRRMARRLESEDVARFVEMSLQSISLGSPLGKVLGELAVEMRARRRADAEERIAKAPVKMLVPTGVLILPAMLIVVMGPVVIELMQGFS